jgi:hypothetical protein
MEWIQKKKKWYTHEGFVYREMATVGRKLPQPMENTTY